MPPAWASTVAELGKREEKGSASVVGCIFPIASFCVWVGVGVWVGLPTPSLRQCVGQVSGGNATRNRAPLCQNDLMQRLADLVAPAW